ncbi:hypothetical protein GJ744_011577 [Endocarpon pusillum]|uniref:Uncharacterized protein n=1 Tax=Endocarpon pusillum TaxID=364733 RepID=A0A8H7AK93_9EURO|nr:hypothetical protein GJ744_011577 [Endocarpon pusillum]
MSERDRGRHSLPPLPRGGRNDALPLRDPSSTATRESLIGLGPFQLRARPHEAAQAQPSTSQSSAGEDISVHGPHEALALLGSQCFTSNQPKHDRSGATGVSITPSVFAAAQQLSLWPPGARQGNSSKPPRVPTRRGQRSVSSASNLRRPQDPELQQRAKAARVEGLTPHANAFSTAAQERDLLPDQRSAKCEGQALFSETAMLGLTQFVKEASVAAAPPPEGRSAQTGPVLAWGTRKSRHAHRELGTQSLTKPSLKTKAAPQNNEEADPGTCPAPGGAAAAHPSGITGRTFGTEPFLDAFQSGGPSSSRRSGPTTGAPPTTPARQIRHAGRQDTGGGSDAGLGSARGAMTGAGAGAADGDAGTSECLTLEPKMTRTADRLNSHPPHRQRNKWTQEARSTVFEYVEQKMPAREISEMTGIPLRTIQLWKQKADPRSAN